MAARRRVVLRTGKTIIGGRCWYGCESCVAEQAGENYGYEFRGLLCHMHLRLRDVYEPNLRKDLGGNEPQFRAA